METELRRWNSTLKVGRGFKRKSFRGQTPDSVSKHQVMAAKRGLGIKPLAKRMKKTRNGPAETKWSREVRERDNYTCQFPGCDKKGKSLDTHHIAPRSLRPDLRRVVSNGITLCRAHHNWVPKHKDEAVRMGLLNLETYELAQKRARVA